MACAAALGLYYALNCTIFDAMVASLLMPDSPTPMSISATMCLSSSCSHPPCYLQDRDEISDDVIHHQAPKRLCESHHSVGNIITVPSGINPRATVASIKVLFLSINASIHTRFTLAHTCALSILHYHECYISPMQGNLPTFQLNATVWAAFIPDSTLEFLPIFSSSKYAKSSIFSGFLHSLQWFDPQKLPRCFQA